MPSPEETISLLRQGICPLCLKDGFRSPLIHIAHTHKIFTRDFRDTYGITYVESLCTPEHHDACVKIANGGAHLPTNRNTGKGGPRSKAGKAKASRNAKAALTIRWHGKGE